MVTTDLIKELRDKTGVSVMQCKKALEDAGGNIEKALIVLRRAGEEFATKKGGRVLGAGVVASYIHATGTIGVLVELHCESDFVAKNEEFKTLAYDIAMHIAALNPRYVNAEQVSDEERAKVTDVFAKEVAKSGKAEDIQKKMMDGKLGTYFKEQTLLDQPFIKNPELTVKGLIDSAVQKFGERMEVARFVRYSVLNK